MGKSKNYTVAALHCPNCGASASTESALCLFCGSSIATRLCPSCFNSVAAGMKHCPCCGTIVPDSTPGDTSTLPCPRCESELETVTVGKRTLHECVHCSGLWIDKETFQDICTREEEQEAVLRFRFDKNDERKKPTIKRKRAYIPCPKCGKLMNHRNFSRCSGVILDWCRDHGSWFDTRELQEIVAFIRNGGLKKAREREFRNLKDEKARFRMQKFELAARTNRLNSMPGSISGLEKTGDTILQFLQDTFFD